MSSNPVAESELRVERTFSTFSGASDSIQKFFGMTGKDGSREWGVGDTRFGSKHRIDAFSLLTNGVGYGAILREGRDGRGTHTPDRLNKAPPCFRGGGQIWKFIFEVGQLLFSGSPNSGHTLIADFVECTEIAFGCINLLGREGKLFQSKCFTTRFSILWSRRVVG